MKMLLIALVMISSAYSQSAGVGQIWTTATGTLQSGATASGNGTALVVGGLAMAVLTVNCSSCSGGTQVNFEGSQDNTNFATILATLEGANTVASSVTTAGLTYWKVPVSGYLSIRARISAYSAGTVTVTGTAVAASGVGTVNNSNMLIGGSGADGNSGSKSAQSLRVVLATDQPQLTNKLLVTPDANSAVNVAQINGATPLMGSGNVGTGSLRVVLATDQAQLTNKLLVTPDANSAVNVAQLNGVTPLMGTGNVGTGSLRVVLATDQAQLTNKLLVTPDANSAVNVAQINGVTPLMGAGNTGTGSPRVTIATDQAQVPISPGTTATTTNAASTSYLTSAASTNSTNVKASAGNVYMIRAINTTATLYYLRMYNLSSAPTCSSATGFIETIPIPASATGAGVVAEMAFGQAYSTGIGFCLTGGGSSTDNTNAATGVYTTILYK